MSKVTAAIAFSALVLGGCHSALGQTGTLSAQEGGAQAGSRRSVRISTDGPGLSRVDWATVRLLPGSRCAMERPAQCKPGDACTVNVELQEGPCVLLVREFSRSGDMLRSYCHDLSPGEQADESAMHASCKQDVKEAHDRPNTNRPQEHWYWWM